MYKKANEGPVFSTVLLFSAILMMYIGFPVLAFCEEFFSVSKIILFFIFIIINTLGVLIILRRYNKKNQ
jgi:TM2 domain-containing membrane protein YozV